MKKLLIVFLALVLILGGLFIWKGGHHAIFLAEELEEWLEEDAADQTLTLQLNIPTFEGGTKIEPVVRQTSLFANTFWTEYGDRRIFGLSSEGYTAYVLDGILYMDTGNAYTLPSIDPMRERIRSLAAGLLLYGRITKDGEIYHITMEQDDLSLSADATVERGLQSLSVSMEFTMDGTPVHLLTTLTPKPAEPHPIPKTVSDAIVRAAMEPPMSLTEPLEILIPAMEHLLPLRAEVTLGVECGILSISETVGLTLENGDAVLSRNGETVPLTLPEEFTETDPVMIALGILRGAEMELDGGDARFRLPLPAKQIGELANQLVPQLQTLGLSFTDGDAVLIITEHRVTQLTLTADAEVPFLITTIPLRFTAEFTVT